MDIEILDILDALEELIESGNGFPLTNKVLIDRDEAFVLIQEIKGKLPDDIKKAKWLSEERARLIKEAKTEAEMIVQEGTDRVKELIEEHVIAQQAMQKAEEITENAKYNASELRLGAKEYADKVLATLGETLEDMANEINHNRSEIQNM